MNKPSLRYEQGQVALTCVVFTSNHAGVKGYSIAFFFFIEVNSSVKVCSSDSKLLVHFFLS